MSAEDDEHRDLGVEDDTDETSTVDGSSSPRTPRQPSGANVEVSNVCVMIRVRPFSKAEIALGNPERDPPVNSIVYCKEDVIISVLDPSNLEAGIVKESFQYDRVFWSVPASQKQPSGNATFATQETVMEAVGVPVVDAVLSGRNSCVFAYGQTGSGKTHTMLGTTSDPGLIPRVIELLFDNNGTPLPAYIERHVTASFLEIYNEKVKDLLEAAASGVQAKNATFAERKVRFNPELGTYVEGLRRTPVSSPADCEAVVTAGTTFRTVAATQMNDTSSRSHAILQLHIRQKDTKLGVARSATLNLVDLAGSERVKMSGVSGAQLAEAKNINLSLTTLRRVIDTLLENSKNPKAKKVAPYRESMLTWVLADSLGGNCKTTMLGTVSPHLRNMEDTLNTLRYALKAKAIACVVKVNEEKCAVVVNALKTEMELLKKQLSDASQAASSPKGTNSLKDRDEELAQQHQQMKREAESSQAAKEQLRRNVVKSSVHLKKVQSTLKLRKEMADETERIKEAIALMNAQRARADQLFEEEKELEKQRLKEIEEATKLETEIAALQEQQILRNEEAKLAQEKSQRDMATILFRTATRFGKDRQQMAVLRQSIKGLNEKLEEIELEKDRLKRKVETAKADCEAVRGLEMVVLDRVYVQQKDAEATVALRSKTIKVRTEQLSSTKAETIRLQLDLLPKIQDEIDRYYAHLLPVHLQRLEEATLASNVEGKELANRQGALNRQVDGLRRQINALEAPTKSAIDRFEEGKRTIQDLLVRGEQLNQEIQEAERLIAYYQKEQASFEEQSTDTMGKLITDVEALKRSTNTILDIQPKHLQLRTLLGEKSPALTRSLSRSESLMDTGATPKFRRSPTATSSAFSAQGSTKGDQDLYGPLSRRMASRSPSATPRGSVQ
jgi:hypothetical protein